MLNAFLLETFFLSPCKRFFTFFQKDFSFCEFDQIFRYSLLFVFYSSAEKLCLFPPNLTIEIKLKSISKATNDIFFFLESYFVREYNAIVISSTLLKIFL